MGTITQDLINVNPGFAEKKGEKRKYLEKELFTSFLLLSSRGYYVLIIHEKII